MTKSNTLVNNHKRMAMGEDIHPTIKTPNKFSTGGLVKSFAKAPSKGIKKDIDRGDGKAKW